jgi:hypothetical protein
MVWLQQLVRALQQLAQVELGVIQEETTLGETRTVLMQVAAEVQVPQVLAALPHQSWAQQLALASLDSWELIAWEVRAVAVAMKHLLRTPVALATLEAVEPEGLARRMEPLEVGEPVQTEWLC